MYFTPIHIPNAKLGTDACLKKKETKVLNSVPNPKSNYYNKHINTTVVSIVVVQRP